MPVCTRPNPLGNRFPQRPRSRFGRSLVVLLLAVLAVTIGAILTVRLAIKPSAKEESSDPIIKPAAKATTPPNTSDESTDDDAQSKDGSIEAPDKTPSLQDDEKASPSSQVGIATEAKPSNQQGFDVDGSWTTRRLIALAKGGPYVIDLNIAIGREDLDSASRRKLDRIAAELTRPTSDGDTGAGGKPGDMMQASSMDSQESKSDANAMQKVSTIEPLKSNDDQEQDDTPLTWAELLEKPLVKSGWLGNLVADDDQREQLISMYDTQRDDLVAADEMYQFLTRGLSRSGALLVTESGVASTASPWGPADVDDDFLLSESEIEQLAENLRKLDRDGDEVLTADEAVTAGDSTNMTMQNGLLQARTLYTVEEDTSGKESGGGGLENGDDEAEIGNRLRAFASSASRILQHYTFLSEVPRSQWPHWNDDQWESLDKDSSGSVDRYEMQRLLLTGAHATIYLRFPDTSEFDAPELPETKAVHCVFAENSGGEKSSADPTFSVRPSGAQLRDRGILIELAIEDQFGRTPRNTLHRQVEAALKNAQVRQFLTQQLSLEEDAISLADRDGDEKLSEIEMKSVWRWVTARQGTRFSGRWSPDATPWFSLLDTDGSARLEPSEFGGAALRLAALDEDDSQTLAPAELPLGIRFTVRRSDTRMEGLVNPTPSETMEDDTPSDWFDAMDLNGDSSISLDEFIGETSDFRQLDQDGDGFIQRADLY